jgi:hypothetical protein
VKKQKGSVRRRAPPPLLFILLPLVSVTVGVRIIWDHPQ